MGEVTRDEIRRACEAVGWRWLDPRVTPGGDDYSSAWDGKMDRFMILPRGADQERYDNADAHALLEAVFAVTGRPYAVRRDEDGFTVTDCGDDPPWNASVTESEYPTAAARAVLAWAEWKETKG